MFNNIEKKVKGLAIVQFIVLIIVGFIVGVKLIYEGSDTLALIGTLILLGGFAIGLTFAILIYGFGQLIENSTKLLENAGTIENKRHRETQSHIENKKCRETQSHIENKRYREVQSNNAPILSSTKNGKCELCEKENVPLFDATIEDDLGTRYRKICMDCYQNYNTPTCKISLR